MQEACAELRKQLKAAQAGLAAANERAQTAQASRRSAAADEQNRLQVRLPWMSSCPTTR